MSHDPAKQLLQQGVALLRGVFAKQPLLRIRDAAERCFDAIGGCQSPPAHYRFNRFSNSLLLTSLVDFGCRVEDLLKPLSAPGLEPLFSETMGRGRACNLEQTWLRKKFAPRHAPAGQYHPQNWHQDGALGVSFPSQPGQPPPMTELLTCWIPLHSCGIESPGLEFILRPPTSLLHFTELGDTTVHQRFPPQDFYAPALELGDGLVFLNSVLHRTHAVAAMSRDRLSIEYRIFPREAVSLPYNSGYSCEQRAKK